MAEHTETPAPAEPPTLAEPETSGNPSSFDDTYDGVDPELMDPQSTDDEGYHYGDHDFKFGALGELVMTHTAASAATVLLK
ncbi:hypothetical protein F4779DRAFT_608838 [Xylariaceae sp. FL0662B]|nr:hypothetical protein F4779DRAFT_608838 [Xylariaceae sp. FL0662B]